MNYNYKYFMASRRFQAKPNRLKELLDLIKENLPNDYPRVLDVGCGLAALVRELRKLEIDTVGVDFASDLKKYFWGENEKFLMIADAKKLPFPDKSFDVVFSSDFFEHINEEDIETVNNEMVRVGKIVLARIAFKTKELTVRQSYYHVTNKEKSWWENKLHDIKLI